MNSKQTTFKGVPYTVPEFVNWIWQNSDGVIKGSQYEPFQINYWTGWECQYGQECTIWSPEVKPHIERA